MNLQWVIVNIYILTFFYFWSWHIKASRERIWLVSKSSGRAFWFRYWDFFRSRERRAAGEEFFLLFEIKKKKKKRNGARFEGEILFKGFFCVLGSSRTWLAMEKSAKDSDSSHACEGWFFFSLLLRSLSRRR